MHLVTLITLWMYLGKCFKYEILTLFSLRTILILNTWSN
jgi:hypothetical protein